MLGAVWAGGARRAMSGRYFKGQSKDSERGKGHCLVTRICPFRAMEVLLLHGELHEHLGPLAGYPADLQIAAKLGGAFAHGL
jgi:hypothetical protein